MPSPMKHSVKFGTVPIEETAEGVNVCNVFSELWQTGTVPKIDYSLIAMIAGLAAMTEIPLVLIEGEPLTAVGRFPDGFDVADLCAALT